MSYKEQIFKELDKVKESGGTATFKGINPKTVRHYTFIFKEIHNVDLTCSIVDGVATVVNPDFNPSVRKYVEDALMKLKNVGDSCLLEGQTDTLYVYVWKMRKKLNMDLFTRVVGNNKLHVVVMGVGE